MQRKEDSVLDKADELTSGWLIEVKALGFGSSSTFLAIIVP